MTKKLILLILFVSFFLNSCTKEDILTVEEKKWLQDNKELKVALYGYYPPYQFKNEYNEVDGIFIDYLHLMESKIDYKFEKVVYDKWSDLMDDAKNDKIDLILEIQETKDRYEYLNFYSEIFKSEHRIVTRQEDANSITFDNIVDKKLVLPKDYGIVGNLKSEYPDIEIHYKANEEECLKVLSDGAYDAYIGPKANSYYLIRNKNLSNLVIIPSKTPYYYNPSVAVPKNKPILSKIIKSVDKSISLDEREVIFNNWLLKKSWPIYYKLKFWITLLFFIGCIICIILYYTRQLKKEVKKRTKEIQFTLDELEKKDDIKTNFIQNISHEIRTPMNGILGYSELLRKENINEAERHKYIDTILDSGKDLVRIIDNILEVSNLQTKKNTVNDEITDLVEVFNNIVSFFRPKALKKGFDIIYKNEDLSEEDFVIIDRLKLIKILKKIINNAITFTTEGFVEISYVKNKNNLEIKVKDTGIGIKKDQKEIIFDSFFQLENEISKKFSGLGLGLTIAKENALILGGNISFISEQGKGSTFFIKLPFIETELVNDIKKSSLKVEKNGTYQILVAEDEEINFLLVNSVLSRFEPYNFLVTRAENGEQAVAICKENNDIDLVLMDIRMPIMDGYKATEKIKQFRPDLPVIAHTAYSTDKDILHAYHAGCDNVISKPININDFKETILNYIKVVQ